MKILRLTTSNDTVHSGPGSRVDWVAKLGEERLGQPIENVTKAVWPDARLAPAVERWLEKEQPDVVWMLLQNFWYEYLSVPKKFERKFGRAGKKVSDLGLTVADKKVISNRWAFRMGRKLLQKTVGGDPHFTPEELYQTVEEVARLTLRTEGRQFVVWGPFSYTNYGNTRRQERDQFAWRARLILRVRTLADELHFHFEAPNQPLWKTEKMPLHGDHFHFATEAQKDLAAREVEMLAKVLADGPISANR